MYFNIFTSASESFNQFSIQSYLKNVNYQYCQPEPNTEGTANFTVYVKFTISNTYLL